MNITLNPKHYIVFDLTTNYLRDLQSCISFRSICKECKTISTKQFHKYYSSHQLHSAIHKIGIEDILNWNNNDLIKSLNEILRLVRVSCNTQIWNNFSPYCKYKDPFDPTINNTKQLMIKLKIKKSPILSIALMFADQPSYLLRRNEIYLM